LAQVLVQPKNAVARQYRKMLRMENDVVLHFTDCGLRAIAKKAMALDTGARGLRSILERLLLEPMFEVSTFSECYIRYSRWAPFFK
jgi:ATP-dependent Clp protease ATP-binding subunit ClpX